MPSSKLVGTYMSTPVHTVDIGASLHDVRTKLRELSISSLGVVEDQQLAGVISYSDLLRVGLEQSGDGPSDQNVHLASARVGDAMSRDAITIDAGMSLGGAAKQMVEGHIHRVYVEANGALAGVLSTRDLMLAVRDLQIKTPILEYMTMPVVTVPATESLATATQSLQDNDISAVVVVDEHGWPIGMFSQREALESGNKPRATPVERAMSPAILALPMTIAMHRAAAQAATMRVRRVAIVEVDAISGILSGLDFARALAS